MQVSDVEGMMLASATSTEESRKCWFKHLKQQRLVVESNNEADLPCLIFFNIIHFELA